MITSDQYLIDIVRTSQRHHELMDKYFNPNHVCFGCLPLAYASLKHACEIRQYNLQDILNELNKVPITN